METNKKKPEIILNLTQGWKCKICGKKQEWIEHEEWPLCCNKSMSIATWKQYLLMADKLAEKLSL